jgi:hypothetical protein
MNAGGEEQGDSPIGVSAGHYVSTVVNYGIHPKANSCLPEEIGATGGSSLLLSWTYVASRLWHRPRAAYAHETKIPALFWSDGEASAYVL